LNNILHACYVDISLTKKISKIKFENKGKADNPNRGDVTAQRECFMMLNHCCFFS